MLTAKEAKMRQLQFANTNLSKELLDYVNIRGTDAANDGKYLCTALISDYDVDAYTLQEFMNFMQKLGYTVTVEEGATYDNMLVTIEW